MLPEVMELVAGREFRCERAVLAGHRRRLLHGRVYPGVVAAPAEQVEGVLFAGLDAAALARLDRFEGALYARPLVRVATAGGESRPAFVYVLRPEHAGLLTETPWDEAAFRARHLRAYLAECRAFLRELEPSSAP